MQQRSTIRARGAAGVLAACAGLALPAAGAHGAERSARWLSAIDGLWSDAANWSEGAVPNNGAGDVFDVTIDAAGAPYLVEMALDVALRDLTLDSADATVKVRWQRSLEIGGVLDLRAGRLNLQGGTLRGGTLRMSGGTLAMTRDITSFFDGVRIEGGDFTIATDGPYAALRVSNGLELTGQTMNAGAARMAFVGSNTLEGGTLRADRGVFVDTDGSLTIAPGAALAAVDVAGNTDSALVNRGALRLGAGISGTIGSLDLVNDGDITLASGTLGLSMLTNSWTNNGAITLGDSASAYIRGVGDNRGAIASGDNSELNIWGDWRNGGDIVAGAGSTMTLGGAWHNDGRIELGPGSTLETDGVWSATRAIVARDGLVRLGGTLNASNMAMLDATGSTILVQGTIENGGQTLDLSALGAMGDTRLTGRVRGGSVSVATLEAYGQSPTLDGVAVVGGDLRLGGAASLSVRVGAGGITTPDGDIVLDSGGGLVAAESVTLDGLMIRQAPLPTGWPRPHLSAVTDQTLTIGESTTVSLLHASVGGQGHIVNRGMIEALAWSGTNSVEFGGASFRNEGVLAVSSADAYTRVTTAFENTGQVRVLEGGRLRVLGGFVNTGAIDITGGTLELSGDFSTGDLGSITNAGGAVRITGDWLNHGAVISAERVGPGWAFDGARILGGEMEGGPGVTLSGAGRLEGITVTGGDLALSGAGGWSIGPGFAVQDGELRVNAAGGVGFGVNATVAGQQITLENTRLNILEGFSLTIGADSIVRAEGLVRGGGTNSSTAVLANDGLIEVGASAAAGDLDLQFREFINRGAVHIGAGSAARFGDGENLGEIVAGPGATVTLIPRSPSGDFTNSGRFELRDALLELRTQTTSARFETGALAGIDMLGGEVRAYATVDNTGERIVLDAGGPVWTAGHIIGGEIEQRDGARLRPTAVGIRLEDVTVLGGGMVFNGQQLIVDGDVTVADGPVRLANGSEVRIMHNATLATPEIVSETGGAVNELRDSSALGVDATVRGAGLAFFGGRIQGRFIADRPGSIVLNGALALGEASSIEAVGGGTIDARNAQFAGAGPTTVVGGHWRVGPGGTIIATSAQGVTESFADITVEGATAEFRGLHWLSRNHGHLTLADGASLELQPRRLAGGLRARDDGPTGVLMASRRGHITVDTEISDFVSDGAITLGAGSTLEVRDAATLAGGHALAIGLDGGAHGLLLVRDGLSIAGRLTIAYAGEGLPAYDSAWLVVQASSLAGAFDEVWLPGVGGRQNWSVEILPDAVAIRFVPAPGGLVMGAVVTPLALRRRRAR